MTTPADQMVMPLMDDFKPSLAFRRLHLVSQTIQVEGGQCPVNGVTATESGFVSADGCAAPPPKDDRLKEPARERSRGVDV